MSLARAGLRLLGRRLPVTDGTVPVRGLTDPAVVRRDRHGIPHARAQSDEDAYFTLGFLHGQDRAFQLEWLMRIARGTVAELIGADALAIDRVSRRIGFARAARAQLEAMDDRERAALEAYAAGVNAARAGRRPHELVLLRRDPTPWTPADSLGVLAVVAFGLAGNWDMELGRLRVLELDGEQALRDVEPAYAEWLSVSGPPGSAAGAPLDRLGEDVAALAAVVGGGGSNNWALAGARTATGKPLVANDPHLSPTLPAFWYLVHLSTPGWSVAGGSVVGTPGVAVGHNEHVAWGVTNSGADVVDLYLEDGEPADARVVEERIEVRDGEPVVERVVVTPRGPIVTPMPDDRGRAFSMRATFLEQVRLAPVLDAPRAGSWRELRERFAAWPGAPLNLVGADVEGGLGWKVVGPVPRRVAGVGLLPQPASAPPWDGIVPAEEMPGVDEPDDGWVATANNKPVSDGSGPWIGADWMDGYRVQRISEELAARADWDVGKVLALQRDVRTLAWRDLREHVLAAPREDPGTARAVSMLEEWDGEMAPGSVEAGLFSLFVSELARRVAAARAPRSVEWALGRGSTPLIEWTYVALRQAGHLARLLRERPDGWFEDGWDAEVAAALAEAVSRLDALGGRPWGSLRPLTLRHPLGGRKPLDRVLNLGPIPYGGDSNTVSQASNPPLDAVGDPLYVATMRVVWDLGDWDRSRVALAGGQSGNPASPHYSDLFEHWRRGGAVPLPWSESAVSAATVATLRLEPA